MYQHFTNCVQFAEYLNYYALADIDVINTTVSKELHLNDAAMENTKIIDHNNNWAPLPYLDPYYIKTKSHEINIGLKASKELFK